MESACRRIVESPLRYHWSGVIDTYVLRLKFSLLAYRSLWEMMERVFLPRFQSDRTNLGHLECFLFFSVQIHQQQLKRVQNLSQDFQNYSKPRCHHIWPNNVTWRVKRIWLTGLIKSILPSYMLMREWIWRKRNHSIRFNADSCLGALSEGCLYLFTSLPLY